MFNIVAAEQDQASFAIDRHHIDDREATAALPTFTGNSRGHPEAPCAQRQHPDQAHHEGERRQKAEIVGEFHADKLR